MRREEIFLWIKVIVECYSWRSMRRLWSECCGFYSSASPSAASSPCLQAIDTLPKAPQVHPSMCSCSNPTISAWLSPPQSRSSSPLCSSSSSYCGTASNGTSDHSSSTTGIEMCCCCISYRIYIFYGSAYPMLLPNSTFCMHSSCFEIVYWMLISWRKS